MNRSYQIFLVFVSGADLDNAETLYLQVIILDNILTLSFAAENDVKLDEKLKQFLHVVFNSGNYTNF